MTDITINRGFRDYDGVDVTVGTITGTIERKGYSPSRKGWFWNIVSGGKVIAVTVGYPPHVTAKEAQQ